VEALHERERESAVLAEALASAREGGTLVVVDGPPGIGKMRLLQAARRQAREGGMRALTARGSELEQRVPFGTLRQLLEPVVVGAAAERRAALFEGAAALAESVFDQRATSGGDVDVDDIFPALHGLFWLVSNLGRERSLALVFDDAQWADAPSLHFLAYLAPRLDDLAAALIVGTRPAVEAGDPLLVRVVTDPAARVLRRGRSAPRQSPAGPARRSARSRRTLSSPPARRRPAATRSSSASCCARSPSAGSRPTPPAPLSWATSRRKASRRW